MGYTLVTFIGKGKPLEEGRNSYSRTKYLIEGKEYETSYFSNALLASGKYEIDRVFVVGTWTSSWAELLETSTVDADMEVALAVSELTDHDKPVSGELLKRVESAVQRLWQQYGVKDVHCVAHASELEGHEREIQDLYLGVMQKISGQFLLDVTHSFRWLPYMMLSTRQLYESLFHSVQPLMVYGEYKEGAVLPMRDLNVIREQEDVSRDIMLFFDRLSADGLASRLACEWPDGAEVIRELGVRLQGNFLIELAKSSNDGRAVGEVLRRLRNVLKGAEDREFKASWMGLVCDRLWHLYDELTEDVVTKKEHALKKEHTSVPGILLNISRLYAKRKFFGQALMCQEMVLRMLAWESRSDRLNFPDWEKSQDALNDYINDQGYEQARKCRDILRNRNLVAHGAMASDRGARQNISDLEGMYREQDSILAHLVKSFEHP